MINDRCPACGFASVYVPSLDRYLHVDGSDSRPCSIRIADTPRAELPYPPPAKERRLDWALRVEVLEQPNGYDVLLYIRGASNLDYYDDLAGSFAERVNDMLALAEYQQAASANPPSATLPHDRGIPRGTGRVDMQDGQP